MPRKRYVYTSKGRPLPEPIEVELDRPVAAVPDAAVVGVKEFPFKTERPPDRSAQVGDWSDFKIPGEQ